MICFNCPGLDSINENYQRAIENYAKKKTQILQQLQNFTQTEGQADFATLLEKELQDELKKKTVSMSGRLAKTETILHQIHNAAAIYAKNLLAADGEVSNMVQTAIEEINSIQQEINNDEKIVIQQIRAELESVAIKIAKKLKVNRGADIGQLFATYLPEQFSKENQELSVSQVIGYCKKIFKQEIIAQTARKDIKQIISKKTAIIMGYRREDATATAAKRLLEKLLGKNMFNAQTVGAAKSKIDVLVTLPGAPKVSNGKDLSGLLAALDAIPKTITLTGESQEDYSKYLGIQVKPWDLSKMKDDTVDFSLGSRATLKNEFMKILMDKGISLDTYSWHEGVNYLSNNIQSVVGANTVMYVTGLNVLWTDDLLSQMVQNNRYFSFALDDNHKVTSHIILARHLCR